MAIEQEFRFFQKTRRSAARVNFGVCIKCKRELVQEWDHILARIFAKWAKRLGIDMRGYHNCGPLCGLCHHKKNLEEAAIDPNDFEAVKAHFLKWYAIHFKKNDERRAMTYQNSKAREKDRRKIATLHAKARSAHRAGDKDKAKVLFGIRSRERKKLRRQ